ncbi:hypothetical protein H4683_002498 [Filibacter limicola]|uniref:Transposase DDE domain-containing protein n=1 Tax=Sporosarcina limicola TaxID=34101 RepID=A0A927R4X9_9BACL|nr:transposase [Sporosarcina limicola]MBE1555393.1 hypothetical protein [Sporosarcina limicola]
MTILPQITLDFNRRIKLSNDSGSLSSDTGVFLFREFDEKLGFTQTLADHLHLNDKRSHFIHSNEKLLSQKLYPALTGSKIPTSRLKGARRSVSGGSTARKSPNGSTNNQWGIKLPNPYPTVS